MDTDPTKLAPPAVTSLRAQTAGALERSHSQNLREKEREDLREAAEQTLNVIVDLNLDATIRWVSPSWVDVIGTKPDAVEGTSIADVVVSEPTTIFTDVLEFMKEDDSGSKFIRFSVRVGPESKLLPPAARAREACQQNEGEEDEDLDVVDLEAQGIMVHDTDGESHVMWMIRPWVAPREIKIDLDTELVDSLGSGAEVLAGYLTRLAEARLDDPTAQTPPPPVLCRICERQIPPWWFEKHTDLCLQEHQAEMEVQMAQESLTEHRHAIVKVLDTLEARKSRPHTGDQMILPVADYKGMPIGPPQSNSSSPGTASPASSGARSRERSSGIGHGRARSFAVRRPQARIVELLLDLCDTAIEISTPAIKDSSTQNPGEFRTQSPQSESRISQVMQWHSPSTNTLEQEHGLALLCADTERIARAKIDAVFRHRKIIEYAERIRIEFAIKVQDCIDGAMRRAARIASGRMSDSPDSDSEIGEEATPAQEDGIFSGSFDAGNTLAMALEKADLSDRPGKRRFSGTIDSTRSSSPKECPTPRSNQGLLTALGQGVRESRRESILPESDTGDTGESEGSVRSSSVASRPPPRTESPISEFGDLRRQASSRSHNRRSWILPGAISPRRQESPSRGAHQPSSPLRISKPRGLGFPQEGIASPEPSPKLLGSEFGSPVAVPHYHHHHHHHRRQSSAAISTSTGDNGRMPPSPRLNGVAAPPMARAVPPSIKDFEVIKPISKGAFGSVYLSKKKSTGEYFAIKVLKKADMVAKNQVTNVKAERAIMMWQGESDFVAKLYWTFSSKDYLYLVMEYLNGGDCASLIKVLCGLPEDWVKKYLGEVVLGVEHLHSRGIVHRDLKPDNLLIDQKGHLKLTDFGLSRMGLVGRQKRALHGGSTEPAPDLLKTGPFARSTSVGSSASRSTSLDVLPPHPSPGSTPQMTPSDLGISLGQPSYFNLGPAQQEPRRISSSHRSDSGGSETLTHMFGNFSLGDSHQASFSQAIASPHDGSEGGSPSLDVGSLRQISATSTQGSIDQGRGTPPQTSMPPPNWALFDPEDTSRRFVGTPDYLAPETIRGEPQDETSDWWSVGCILYEFLYGVPPFHAGEPEQVFENILARRIHWPDESEVEVSPEAKDLINRLLCIDPRERLGSNKDEKFASGGEEIRHHPWFQGLNWETLLEDEAQFVPQPENPEDTEYFDARGATLQAFAEEMEDQVSPQPGGPATDYPERPHDALSRVRSQVNSMKRGLMPLHIPPHVRDLKSRRLSEPMANDDFGNFAYKNLPVLDKANKDVIQKLRADALAAQSKTSAAISPGGISQATSPGAAGLEGSPVLSNPVHRSLSNAKATQRPQSPSALSNTHSSPNRASQPSSPLLVSFVAGQEGRRKASSNASNLSQQSSSNSSLQPGNFFDVPRVPPSLQKAATSVAVSPGKGRGSVPPPLSSSPHKPATTSRPGSGSGPSSARSRSRTVGSQEGSPVAADLVAHHRNRRSQVFDMSPSSSDNEGDKANAALLRVQRRRQSSRRMSQIAYDSPTFRPLDVLICEDHPVSRMVMEKLLEKLRCRTISASTGPEAVRYAMSDIKFDVIFMEFKLPQISGADVAKMIRETKNANSHTPLVAITAYLKELQAPHYFDSLIEKPISSSKLTEVLTHFCQWKTASPSQSTTMSLALAHPVPSSLRQESLRLEDSPTSGTSSGFANRPGSSFRGSSRDDSVSSSLFGDSESMSADEIPVVISRKATGDWSEHGLGIEVPSEEPLVSSHDTTKGMPPPTVQNSAPGLLEHDTTELPIAAPQPRHSFERLRAKREIMEKRRLEGNTGIDSADDEDEELGLNIPGKGVATGPTSAPALFQSSKQHFRSKSVLPSSKLGVEMMRANSHDSVHGSALEGVGATEPGSKTLAIPSNEVKVSSQLSGPTMDAADLHAGALSFSPTPVVKDEEEEKTVTIHVIPSVEGTAAESDFRKNGADAEETPKRPVTAERVTAERETTPTRVEVIEGEATPKPRERSVETTTEQAPGETARAAENS